MNGEAHLFFSLDQVCVLNPLNPAEHILSGINLSIPAYSRTVILGESGSGKSTLARLLKGLYMPSRGCVLVDGLNTILEEERRVVISRVGLVSSNPSQQLVAPMVEDDIMFGLDNLGVSVEESRKRVEEIMSFLGISHLGKRMTFDLSMGEQLMVATAGVLVMEPRALVLDEPRTFVGPREFRSFFSRIMELQAGGEFTLVWITHNPEDVFVADNVVVLSKGKVSFVGSRDQFFRAEMNRFLRPELFRLKELLSKQGIVLEGEHSSLDDVVKEICSWT